MTWFAPAARASPARNDRWEAPTLAALRPRSRASLAGHAMECAIKPASKTGRIEVGTALPVIVNAQKPTVCRQTQVTVAFDELPFWQPLIPGTAAHQWSIHRRSNVESAFSHIKDEATQSVRRGDIRVMGIAKVTLAVLLNAMAANLAEVARWRERSTGVRSLDDARERKARKPRRITIKREADKPRRAEARAKHAAEKEAAKARLQAVSDEFENPPGGGYAPPSV